MIAIELTAPAHWASYLINNDPSSMDDIEILVCDAWLKSTKLGRPVSCTDEAEFLRHHDASQFSPYAADCLTYTFLKN